MLTYFEEQHGQSECDEGTEGGVELVVACGDAPVILQVMKQAFDLVASLVELLIVTPGFSRIRFRWNNGNTSLFSNRTACFGICIAFVHHDAGSALKRNVLEQLATFR